MVTYLTNDEIKREELALLCIVRDACKQYGWSYSLAGGTLLGAVRHHGFIPWDDDVDVMLPRPSYDAFLHHQTEIERDYSCVFLPVATDILEESPYIRLANPRVVAKQGAAEIAEPLFIDVFPTDAIADNQDEALEQLNRAAFLRRTLWVSMSSASAADTAAKKAIMTLSKPIVSTMASKRSLCRKLAANSQKHVFGTTKRIAGLAWGLYGEGEIIPADSFDNPTLFTFEDETFAAISSWEDYLIGHYHDYMQLPPEDKRVSHNLVAWRCDDDAKTQGDARCGTDCAAKGAANCDTKSE